MLTVYCWNPEDFVLLCLPRGSVALICMLGVWKAGAALTLVEDNYPPERITYIKKDCNCKAVIDMQVWSNELPHMEPLAGFERADLHDAALAIYTSGTTGNAKGVMLSHRNFCANVEESWFAHHVYRKDVFLSILPLAHTYEMSIGMLYPFARGASVFYIQKPPTPTVLMGAISKLRPSTPASSCPICVTRCRGCYTGWSAPSLRSSSAGASVSSASAAPNWTSR